MGESEKGSGRHAGAKSRGNGGEGRMGQAGIHAVFEGDLPRKQGIFLAQRRTKANILVLAHAKFQPYVTSGADAVLKHTHRRRHRNMANKAVYSILSTDNSDG